MVNFESEVLAYLNLPAIPKKEWNGTDEFKNGVAVVSLRSGGEAYAVASFDPEKDSKPNVTKVFGYEPFGDILRVYLVPDYMETDIENADLDDESKKKAEEIINEANEIENEGTELETPEDENQNPWVFDEIHNLEEAQAWLTAYNVRNKIQGRIPSKEDTIKLRLLAIKAELDAKNKD